ncbi:transglutaminase-like domain-containing protein [Nocardia tengchongensis]|uniref:transglutaminase-like domain-containing protein n=1 Tax=Nocardia tengchongensis TaxID=2055889 RepID=UPI003619D931
MKREVSTALDITVQADSVLEFQVAVAHQSGVDLIESTEFILDGRPLWPREITGPHGTRIHVVNCPEGRLEARYRATALGSATPEPASGYDLAMYLRPSRFAESDKLLGFAATEFGCGIDDPTVPERISAWVRRRICYLPGSSDPVDGAVETLLSGAGVCRDFTHLVVALLRAVGVPARVAAVYAPGCTPMDFHSVAEAYVSGRWLAFDPTCLAPRSSLLRIATGRDASDIAFLANHGGDITLTGMTVNATVEGTLPIDDLRQPTAIR